MLEQIGFSGGKIFKKAKGVGNSSHTVTRSLSRNLKYSGNHKSKLFYLSPATSIRGGGSNGKTLTGYKKPGLNLIMSDMANQSKSYCNYAQSRYISTDTAKYGISTLDTTNLQQISTPLDEWKNINWREVESSVQQEQIKLVKLAGTILNLKDSDDNLYQLQDLSSLHSNKEISKLQIRLAKTLVFRQLAVQKVISNAGAKTPGIDGFIIKTDQDKLDLINQLKIVLITSEKPSTVKDRYKASPVKRVMIPKDKGKLRPLGIPTIFDRCLQAVINLVLEPIVELTSDRHSFGFRKHRGAKNAVASVRMHLKSGHENKWILDAEIKSFFDEISHDWLLNNIPLPKPHLFILKSLLKSGVIESGSLIKTEAGTPQGGIISPTIANFTLNGLETHIRKSINHITGGKDNRKNIYLPDGTRHKLLTFPLRTVRFADVIVVIASSKNILETFVRPAVKDFLAIRGLRLSEEKTKIFSMICGTELDFLGYTLKYRDNWSKKYSFFKDRIGLSGIALYPNKLKMMEHIKKLKKVFNLGQNKTAYELISELNPIIRGWANYFNMGESSTFRSYIRFALYNFVWNWAHKKHPKWGKKAIAATYFNIDNKKNKNSDFLSKLHSNKTDYSGKLIRDKWTFMGITNNPSRYSEASKGKIIFLLDPTKCTTSVAALNYNIPESLSSVHAYHEKAPKLILLNIRANIKGAGINEGLKGKLFLKQNGNCLLCLKSLLPVYSDEKFNNFQNNLHIDHIKPISLGGSKTALSNLRLLHSWCHINQHQNNKKKK